jgi:chromate transporter
VGAFFLALGTVAFGGPAAHVAMMEDQVVRRRGWLTRAEFLDLLGASNLLPGPSSTELAIFIGYRVAGWAGLLLGGVCFILPAALIVTALAWIYVRSGSVPAVAGVLRGVQPVVIAVLAQALWSLGRASLKSRALAAAGVVALALAAVGAPPIAVLAAGAALAIVAARVRPARAVALLPIAATATVVPYSLGALFLAFLKVGALLFGSGYVLLAFLRADLVTRLGWLSERQLLDAVAVGQVTPGPVFTTATFIGYVLGAGAGAWVATIAIFLPSFAFVALSGPLIPRIRASRIASAALDGASVASLALIAIVTIQLARVALTGLVPVAIAIVSAALMLRFRVNSALMMLGAAIVGALVL